MNTEIPVFFSIDDGYSPFLAAALCSAIKNCDKSRRFRAIVLHENVSEKNKQRLKALETDNFSIDFIPMEKGFEGITDRISNRFREKFTLTIYFRLFIPTMFPEYDKAIYIDSDVIVTGDLAGLYDTDIGNNFFGACADLSVVDVEPLAKYMEEAVGVDRDKYVNSGVLLMNTKKLRESGFEKHFLDLLTTYHFETVAPDQDYINAICKDKIYYLDPSWDAMPADGRPELENVNLIHYNLFSKPWCLDNVQYERYFWEYSKQSGYYSEAKAFKDGYKKEQQEADAKCLERLIENAIKITSSEITMRKMQEKGVKIRL